MTADELWGARRRRAGGFGYASWLGGHSGGEPILARAGSPPFAFSKAWRDRAPRGGRTAAHAFERPISQAPVSKPRHAVLTVERRARGAKGFEESPHEPRLRDSRLAKDSAIYASHFASAAFRAFRLSRLGPFPWPSCTGYTLRPLWPCGWRIIAQERRRRLSASWLEQYRLANSGRPP